MTETEKKALALVGGILPEDAYRAPDHFIDKRILWNALCRAIEQHETDIADLQAEYDEVCKLFEAFKREVSDAVEGYTNMVGLDPKRYFARFIIAKPDPLVEVMQDWWDADGYANIETFRAALAARGLEVRKIGEGE